MTNLKVGTTYVIVGQYKIGEHALDNTKGNAKPGDKMLAIDIDGVVKTTLVAPSDKKDPTKLAGSTWLEFSVSFKATKTTHNLRLRGEIEGKDADVYIDEVSVSAAPEHLVNGNFDHKLSTIDWKLENIDVKWGGYQTEKLKDGTTNGYIWVNYVGKKQDPALVQTMKHLKPGKTYIITCQYRNGRGTERMKIKPGTPLVAIVVDGEEKTRAYAASAQGDPKKLDLVSWNSMTAKFKATKAEHVVRIKAEIDGFDGDVDIDNVTVVEIE